MAHIQMEVHERYSTDATAEPPKKRIKLNSLTVKVVDKLGPMPDGEKTLQKRKRYLAPSQVLHYRDVPLKIVRGQGQYLFDEVGNKYLDTCNNVSHVGHSHPVVVEACSSQMAILNTNSRFLNDKIVTYAQRLCNKFPKKLNSCFFTNSGSEANDLALQIAQSVTGNQHVVSIDGSYHGHLMSLKRLSSFKLGKGREQSQSEEQSSKVSILSTPDPFRGEFRDPETAGELHAFEAKIIIDNLKAKGIGVGAFIHESTLCCAGMVTPPKGYFEAVYEYIHTAGGLCIADEVQTGFGRSGKHFWAFENHGIVPDIVTLGKPMGNGHPVAGVVTTKEIAEKFAGTGVEYFNTFGGNPVSMAVADAVLRVIETQELQKHSYEMGTYLKEGLEGLMEKHSCIGDVRGQGLFIGVEFVRDRETNEPDAEIAHHLEKQMLLDHKIIVLADGIYRNVIKFKPPLSISKKDCTRIVKGVDAVLTKLLEV